MSYNCPLLKFTFPDFTLSSFDILASNLVYEFVFTFYKSSSTFVALYTLSLELLPFTKIKFAKLFCVAL